MVEPELEFDPVTHLTADAIGQPGERVFYLQAQQDANVSTFLIEKVQLQSLSLGVEEFLSEIAGRFPELPVASGEYEEENMRIQPPVDPLFRVGDLGLAYDSERDMICLVVHEVLVEGQTNEDVRSARLWCSRSQLRRMGNWINEVVSRGRQICPQCGQPMDPAGHFCPKKNGHKH